MQLIRLLTLTISTFLLVLFLSFKEEKDEAISSEFSTIESDREGGTYMLKNGIQLILPACAVNNSVRLTINELALTRNPD